MHETSEQSLLESGGKYLLALNVEEAGERVGDQALTLVGGPISGQPVEGDDDPLVRALSKALDRAVDDRSHGAAEDADNER